MDGVGGRVRPFVGGVFKGSRGKIGGGQICNSGGSADGGGASFPPCSRVK